MLMNATMNNSAGKNQLSRLRPAVLICSFVYSHGVHALLPGGGVAACPSKSISPVCRQQVGVMQPQKRCVSRVLTLLLSPPRPGCPRWDTSPEGGLSRSRRFVYTIVPRPLATLGMQYYTTASFFGCSSVCLGGSQSHNRYSFPVKHLSDLQRLCDTEA